MTDLETALAQLDAFAAKNGKQWRDKLMFDYWLKGAAVPGFPLVYGLRNQFGPSWLATYKPKPVPAP